MNRQEHLQWAKDRALEYAQKGDIQNAFLSMQSDMAKHEELANHLALQMGTMLLMGGNLKTESEITNWIIGFN